MLRLFTSQRRSAAILDDDKKVLFCQVRAKQLAEKGRQFVEEKNWQEAFASYTIALNELESSKEWSLEMKSDYASYLYYAADAGLSWYEQTQSKRDLRKALTHFQLMMKAYQDIPVSAYVDRDYFLQASAYLSLGQLAQRRFAPGKAIDYLERGIDILCQQTAQPKTFELYSDLYSWLASCFPLGSKEMNLFILASQLFARQLQERKHESRKVYSIFVILNHHQSTSPFSLLQLIQVIYITCRSALFPDCSLKKDMQCDKQYAFIERQMREAQALFPRKLLEGEADQFAYQHNDDHELEDVLTRLRYVKL